MGERVTSGVKSKLLGEPAFFIRCSFSPHVSVLTECRFLNSGRLANTLLLGEKRVPACDVDTRRKEQ